MEDTYGHARRMSNVENYNGGNRRNGPGREPQRRNRQNQYVNCAVGDQGEGQGNRDYNGEESDNSDRGGDPAEWAALLTENGDNSASTGLETEEIDGRGADSAVEAYLATRRVAGTYRSSHRAIECDVLKRLRKRIRGGAKAVKGAAYSKFRKAA